MLKKFYSRNFFNRNFFAGYSYFKKLPFWIVFMRELPYRETPKMERIML